MVGIMSGNESSTEDVKIIKFFEAQIAWRKAATDRELWLANLKEIYEVSRPLLNLSESYKEEIHRMIIQAINQISR